MAGWPPLPLLTLSLFPCGPSPGCVMPCPILFLVFVEYLSGKFYWLAYWAAVAYCLRLEVYPAIAAPCGFITAWSCWLSAIAFGLVCVFRFIFMFAAMSALVEPAVVGEFPLGCVPLRSPLAPELNISQILIPQKYLVKWNLEDYSFILSHNRADSYLQFGSNYNNKALSPIQLNSW